MAIAKKVYTYYDAEQALLSRIVNGDMGDQMGAADALKNLRQANNQAPIRRDEPKAAPDHKDSVGPVYLPAVSTDHYVGDPNGWHNTKLTPKFGNLAAPATNEYSHPVPTNVYAHLLYADEEMEGKY